jgi:phosphoribosyl 1,2-cyclic phosphodiesterase
MRARIWGCRGSLATPGPGTAGVGGNTSCLEVRDGSGAVVVLDAGTGIRPLGATLGGTRELDLLLTHLHLDHIEGLAFFAPLHDPECSVRIWGPPQEGTTLAERLATWLSPPFFPVPFERFEARIAIHEVPAGDWEVGGLRVRSARTQHPGPTLAYRLEEDGRALAYVPDNEPGLGGAEASALAGGADVLLHDAQYTAAEYAHRVGWGHASVDDFARVVREARPGRALLFHHDPGHDDEKLRAMRGRAAELADREVELAAEGLIL